MRGNIKQNKIGHYEVRVTQSVVVFVMFCITLFVLVGFGHGIEGLKIAKGFFLSEAVNRRTSDNTMAKTNKDKQSYAKHIEERMILSDVL
jgi:formate/nitrite transporter FocA (FNT family)